MFTYHYDINTKEYTHKEEACLDPLETELKGKNIYLMPANATFAIPALKEGYKDVWNGEMWEQLEDNRGKEYWLDTDTYGTPAKTMNILGPFPSNAVFVAPQKTLNQIKNEKIESLKTERDTLEVEPIEYNGHLFDYDDKARDRINAAIIALDLQGEDATLSWTCADQSETIVTANDLRMVIAAVAVRSNMLHIAYRNAKEKVLVTENKENVETITLEFFM